MIKSKKVNQKFTIEDGELGLMHIGVFNSEDSGVELSILQSFHFKMPYKEKR